MDSDYGGLLSVMKKRSLGNCCYVLKQKGAPDNADQNAAEPTAFDGVGIVLKINGSSLGMLEELLPGARKAGKFQSNLVMLTCHSVLQSIEESSLEYWRITSLSSGVGLKEVEWHTLNTFVSGAVSCCGKHSLIGPGEHSLHQHNDIKCDLNLNFTLLFLKAEFKSLFISKPCVEISLPINRRIFFEVVNIFVITPSLVSPKKAQQEASKQLQYAGEKANNNTIPGTFSLFCRNRLGHFQLVPIHVSSPKALDVSTTGSLEDEVSLMKKFLSIEYTVRKEDATDCLPPGSPIVYGTECNNLRVIGMHPGEPRSDGVYHGVTIHGVFQLLQGGPVACFCLLSNPQANMLWQDRWENLLLPYLRNESSIDVRRLLEISLYFTKKLDGVMMVNVNKKDLISTRVSSLNLIAALFHQFSRFSPSEINSALQVIDHETEVLDGIASLCEEVVMCVQHLADINLNSSYDRLIDACSSCCCEMLNFKSRGIIEEKFKQGSFLQQLETLQRKYTCDGSRDRFLTNIAEFYKKLYYETSERLACMETNEAQSQATQQQGYKQELSEKNALIASIKKERSTVFESLKVQGKEKQKMQEMISELNDRIERLQNELERTEVDLREQRESKTSLLGQYQFLKQEYEMLTQSERSAKRDNEDIAAKLEEQNQAIGELQHRYQEEKQQLSESFDEERRQLGEKYDNLQQEYVSLKEAHSTEKQQLLEKIKDLQREKESSKAARSLLRKNSDTRGSPFSRSGTASPAVKKSTYSEVASKRAAQSSSISTSRKIPPVRKTSKTSNASPAPHPRTKSDNMTSRPSKNPSTITKERSLTDPRTIPKKT